MAALNDPFRPEGARVPDMTPGRRRFVTATLGAIAAVITRVIGVPLAGFFALPALRRTERRWLEVGPVADFVEGQVVAKPLVAPVWPQGGRLLTPHEEGSNGGVTTIGE